MYIVWSIVALLLQIPLSNAGLNFGFTKKYLVINHAIWRLNSRKYIILYKFKMIPIESEQDFVVIF
jgi:hypothetical protein